MRRSCILLALLLLFGCGAQRYRVWWGPTMCGPARCAIVVIVPDPPYTIR